MFHENQCCCLCLETESTIFLKDFFKVSYLIHFAIPIHLQDHSLKFIQVLNGRIYCKFVSLKLENISKEKYFQSTL